MSDTEESSAASALDLTPQDELGKDKKKNDLQQASARRSASAFSGENKEKKRRETSRRHSRKRKSKEETNGRHSRKRSRSRRRGSGNHDDIYDRRTTSGHHEPRASKRQSKRVSGNDAHHASGKKQNYFVKSKISNTFHLPSIVYNFMHKGTGMANEGGENAAGKSDKLLSAKEKKGLLNNSKISPPRGTTSNLQVGGSSSSSSARSFEAQMLRT